jgi:hypothetical protein
MGLGQHMAVRKGYPSRSDHSLCPATSWSKVIDQETLEDTAFPIVDGGDLYLAIMFKRGDLVETRTPYYY